MIKYVALQARWKPGQGFRGRYAKDGWVSSTWKRPVLASHLEDAWASVCTTESSAIPVDNLHFQVLPKVLDREGKPMPPFKGIDIRQPTLSLSKDDGTVYFMTKKDQHDDKAWVIAVDMGNNTLRGVAEFAAERTVFRQNETRKMMCDAMGDGVVLMLGVVNDGGVRPDFVGGDNSRERDKAETGWAEALLRPRWEERRRWRRSFARAGKKRQRRRRSSARDGKKGGGPWSKLDEELLRQRSGAWRRRARADAFIGGRRAVG
ncbi:hypothetical protein PR202_ga21480 [Eleusine coracana subsp. coracana]|uniref:DUF1618 domain-containing protein n=1 Tax=Eleusine coracana subsp. coracana TaxID=191504 RepID=A0AAV5CZS2_ELECO|nr:hypothetical protein PR202_ga21480 [Eleusine coracana subsp. coracana]